MSFEVGARVYLTANVSRENLHIKILPDSLAHFPQSLPAGSPGVITAMDRKGLTVRFSLQPEPDGALVGDPVVNVRFKYTIIGSLLDMERREGSRQGKHARRIAERYHAARLPLKNETSAPSLVTSLFRFLAGPKRPEPVCESVPAPEIAVEE